jgi:hypothetical protein
VFLQKSFWLVFVSFSAFHMVEDLLWAIIARFTDTPMYLIFLGILAWAMLTTIFVYSKPVKKHWKG